MNVGIIYVFLFEEDVQERLRGDYQLLCYHFRRIRKIRWITLKVKTNHSQEPRNG